MANSERSPRTIITEDFLGRGSEYDVFTRREGSTVIKVPQGCWWQTPGMEYAQGSLEAMKECGLPIDNRAQVIANPTVVLPDGNYTNPEFVIEAPLILDLAGKRLLFADLCDAEKGLGYMRALIEMIKGNHRMNKHHQRGVDPFGLALIKDSAIGIGHRVVHEALIPRRVREAVQETLLPEHDCAVNNIVKTDKGGVELIDYGLHDLSPNRIGGPFRAHRPLITFAQHVGIAGLLEMIATASKYQPRPKRISMDEIDGLYAEHFGGNVLHRLLAQTNMRALEPILLRQ